MDETASPSHRPFRRKGQSLLSLQGTAGIFAVTLTVLITQPLAAADLRCPPRLPGPHPGFEQVGPIPAAHWLLWRMRLFNSSPSRDQPVELTPGVTAERRDAVTLTWHPAGIDDLVMVCLYNGSGTYYRAHPRSLPASCTMRNDNGLTQAWCEQP